MTFWHGIFMVMTVGVVAFGVEKGLERAVSVLMPILFVLLLILLGYGMNTGHFTEAVGFLFTPDWSQVSGGMIVTAMGQAFFTLSLGMCAIMTYGAYLPSGVSVPRVGTTVVIADTLVALVAGLAIFPIVISFGLDPAGGGPGLIFTSLPLAFAQMPFGILYGMAFFILLSVAAWTSSISLMEPATAYLVESTNLSRKTAALCCGGTGLDPGSGERVFVQPVGGGLDWRAQHHGGHRVCRQRHHAADRRTADCGVRRLGAVRQDHPRGAGRQDARLGLQAVAVADPGGHPGPDPGCPGQPDEHHLMLTALHEQRLDTVFRALQASGARRVMDLGCGSGALLARLINEPSFERILGMDRSAEALTAARQNLLGDETDQRVQLVHGSWTEPHKACTGYDAAALVETIEHLDPRDLSRMENTVFRDYQLQTIVLTTPNGDYNPLLGLGPNDKRDPDHRFEWPARASANGAAAWPIATVTPSASPASARSVVSGR
jgi:SAM-dependent methyltransferase